MRELGFDFPQLVPAERGRVPLPHDPVLHGPRRVVDHLVAARHPRRLQAGQVARHERAVVFQARRAHRRVRRVLPGAGELHVFVFIRLVHPDAESRGAVRDDDGVSGREPRKAASSDGSRRRDSHLRHRARRIRRDRVPVDRRRHDVCIRVLRGVPDGGVTVFTREPPVRTHRGLIRHGAGEFRVFGPRHCVFRVARARGGRRVGEDRKRAAQVRVRGVFRVLGEPPNPGGDQVHFVPDV
mmetsp:Transcript_5895/g.23882  ORF Transcript_5895/g.23882 Transcript_5895/m.23882 type:complete len:240 (+) Transcript_5895:159-878(+)